MREIIKTHLGGLSHFVIMHSSCCSYGDVHEAHVYKYDNNRNEDSMPHTAALEGVNVIDRRPTL